MQCRRLPEDDTSALRVPLRARGVLRAFADSEPGSRKSESMDTVFIERYVRYLAGACRRSFQRCSVGGALLLAGAALAAERNPGGSGELSPP